MPDVEFIPVATLADDGGATTADYARSRGRWQALPDGWLSAKAMCEAVMQVCRIPDYDLAGGEAAMGALSDFLEVRGSGRALEYRRVETPPEPMSPAEILERETTRRAGEEHERFEREMQAREARHREMDKAVLDANRRLWNELCDESVTPQLAALEARIAELEGQLAQHGELAAVGAASTPAPTAIEAPAAAESRLARVRRFMVGDMTEADIDRVLEEDEDE